MYVYTYTSLLAAKRQTRRTSPRGILPESLQFKPPGRRCDSVVSRFSTLLGKVHTCLRALPRESRYCTFLVKPCGNDVAKLLDGFPLVHNHLLAIRYLYHARYTFLLLYGTHHISDILNLPGKIGLAMISKQQVTRNSIVDHTVWGNKRTILSDETAYVALQLSPSETARWRAAPCT